MPIRFIQIGDFHAAPGPRNADRYAALDVIVAEGQRFAQTGTLGGWLWPGDLFDALSATDDRNAIDQRLQQMAAVAPVLICYGNHDRAGDLDGFANLAGAWPILVVSRPGVVRLALPTGGRQASVFVLPYPMKAMLVGAGVATGDVVGTAADLLMPIFIQAGHDLAVAQSRGDIAFMIGHCNVAGAIASTGQPNIGREIEVSAEHLDRLGSIPKLLNHIHKPQQIAGAHYAGSVCRLSYGETEEKRFLIVDYTDDPNLPPAIVSRPLAVAPMFLVGGDIDFDGDLLLDSGDEEIERRFDARDWTGCDVRVLYRYPASRRSLVQEPKVRAHFETALRLKVEGVAQADRDLRSPTVAAARTLPEKLAAYAGVSILEASTADKLALLEHGDEAALLAAVARDLKEIESPAAPEKATVAA